jgi:hypothetical protein
MHVIVKVLYYKNYKDTYLLFLFVVPTNSASKHLQILSLKYQGVGGKDSFTSHQICAVYDRLVRRQASAKTGLILLTGVLCLQTDV